MKFSQYTWNLYKNSPEGKEAIRYFSEAEGYEMFQKYCPNAFFIPEDLYNDWLANIYCYGISDYERPASIDEAGSIYDELITLGLSIEDKQWTGRNDFKNMLDLVQPISYCLYEFSPEYFFPYLFLCRIYELNKIADAFNIELPKLPKRYDYKGRCLYYWEICKTMYSFRMDNQLSTKELCAFLYDFAPKYLEEIEIEIPQPSQAWIIGGKLYPKDKALESKFWQSSPNTQKGDILVHYETSPISAITCIEISQTDGVIDPLFHYYGNIYIGNRMDIPSITLGELKSDSYFSRHPLIRKNFRGVNGCLLSGEDYSELLRMIRSKGFDTGRLPKLYIPELPKNVVVEYEKDVETNLLEPLLNAMGWYEHKNYIRKLPIHAGRGHRIFPDYALHYDNKPEEEKAKVLIEAKLYMKTNQDLESTFLQARSYAQLLSSYVIVLCDKYCLIVYERKDSFDRDRYKKYYWRELENPDLFNELKNKLNI